MLAKPARAHDSSATLAEHERAYLNVMCGFGAPATAPSSCPDEDVAIRKQQPQDATAPCPAVPVLHQHKVAPTACTHARFEDEPLR